MKILLFGGSGQLGFELKKRAIDLSFEIASPVTKELDITDKEGVISFTRRLNPDLVINSAAYTAVDKAETEPDQAFAINHLGAKNIAEACKLCGTRMIHISTDYVFDGKLGRPLKEDDRTNPVSKYGESKLAGEHEVIGTLGERGMVVRTSSLHGQKGINFVHTMLKLFPEQPVLKIVSDQIMSPTWAGWLAEVLLDLGRTTAHGIIHASCQGSLSWYEFANEIKTLSIPSFEGKTLSIIEETTAEDLKRPAKRPVYSAFDTSKLESILRRPILPWKQGLLGHLKDIGVVR